MMEQRKKLRTQVENQKKAILDKFEEVKKQGSGTTSAKELAEALSAPKGKGEGLFAVEQTSTALQSQQSAAPWRPKPHPKPSPTSKLDKSRDSKPQVSDGKEKIGALRKRQNDELLQLLESEQKQEELREKQLSTVTKEVERNRLEKIFGMERARSSQKIVQMSECGIYREHNKALKALAAKFGVALEL